MKIIESASSYSSNEASEVFTPEEIYTILSSEYVTIDNNDIWDFIIGIYPGGGIDSIEIIQNGFEAYIGISKDE